jgi:glycosyltransferase involved in cell wall biosynthesis
LVLGGSELQLVALMRGLDRQMYEVYFCHLRPNGGEVNGIDLGETTTVCLNRSRRYEPKLLWRLRSVMRDNRIDILYTVLSTADIWGRVSGIMAGVPAMVCRKGTVLPGGDRGNYEAFFDRLLAPYTACVIANSRVGMEVLIQSGRALRGKTAVVYNGTDLRRFTPPSQEMVRGARARLGLDPNTFVVGAVGRLDAEKGWDVVLEAIASLGGEHTEEIRCVIAGDGPMMPSLRGSVARLGLEDRVVLLGRRTDVPEVMACMDVVVLASEREGIPNVLCEAMAMAKPVIATDVGGVRELVVDEECGLLIEPRNWTQLGSAIRRMLAQRASISQWGVAGRRRVEELFSLERMVTDTHQVFQRIMTRTMRIKTA